MLKPAVACMHHTCKHIKPCCCMHSQKMTTYSCRKGLVNPSAVPFTVRRELNSLEVISCFMDKTFNTCIELSSKHPILILYLSTPIHLFKWQIYIFLNFAYECSGSYFCSHYKAEKKCLFYWLSIKQTWQIKTQNSFQALFKMKKNRSWLMQYTKCSSAILYFFLWKNLIIAQKHILV